jgi:hypothetical protein
MSAPSPLLGFNDNVRHRGQVFHIQTEDSGVRYPHVITHLFADGGRILKTVKTSYAEHVGSERLGEHVAEVMKRQHRAVFIALRDGRLDDIIDAPPGSIAKLRPARTTTPDDGAPAGVAAPPSMLFGASAPPSSRAPGAESAGAVATLDLASIERVALGSDSVPPLSGDAGPPSRYARARPASIFAADAPPRRELLEASLDDAVLAFLDGEPRDPHEPGGGAR